MFITESISLGKPLLLSDNNGMQDMIEDGINGYVTKTGNPIDAAEKIKKFIELGEKELITMGEASQKIYENHFSPREIYKQFDYLLSIHEGMLDE